MYLKIKLLFLLYVFIYFTSCTEGKIDPVDHSHNYELRLKKIREFKIDTTEKIKLDRIREVIVFNHDESLIGWLNEDQNRVIITDTSGNIISSFGGVGRGPEEFLRISALGFNEQDNLFIYDSNQDLLKVFDSQGNLKESYKGLIQDKLWIRSNKLFVNGNHLYLAIQEAEKSALDNHWESKTIAKYTKRGELVDVFGEYDPSLKGAGRLYKYANLVVDVNSNQVFTTHRTLNTIQVFDLHSQKKIARFGFLTEKFKITEDEAKISDPRYVKNKKNLKQSFVDNSFITENYFFFYFFNFSEVYWQLRDPNQKEHFFYIFLNREPYAFLGEINLPYQPLGVTRNGSIYLLENDNPDNFTIGVYEIIATET